jgi:signal peptidase II
MKSKPWVAKRHYLILFTVVLGIIILDQITKAIIDHTMRLHESIVVLEGFFAITYIRNPGAAFGFLSDLSDSFRFYFFFIVSIVALSFLTFFFYKTRLDDYWTIIGISLVGGGALGNLIDRMRFGEVVDFLDFFIGSYHWPAFNVADSAISIGLVLLIFHLFVQSRKDAAKIHTPSFF